MIKRWIVSLLALLAIAFVLFTLAVSIGNQIKVYNEARIQVAEVE